MRRTVSPSVTVVTILIAALVFAVWCVSQTVTVDRQRKGVAANVHLYAHLNALEESVAGLEQILRSENGLDPSTADAVWDEQHMAYVDVIHAFTSQDHALPEVTATLVRIEELIGDLKLTRDRLLETRGDPAAQLLLRKQFRETMIEAAAWIRDLEGVTRNRLYVLSAGLTAEWRKLGAVAISSCLLVMLTVGLFLVAQRQSDRRRETEQRLRLLIEQMPAMLWTIDKSCRITSSRGSGLKGLGLEQNQLRGLTLFEYLQTDDPTFPAVGAHLRALEGESVNYEMEWSGNVYEAHVEPLRDDSGSIVGAVGVCLDVTELARERLRSQKLESLGVLAGGIAHDFNNFLQAMLGNLALLRMDLDVNEGTRVRLEETERAARRARRLTQQLLTFSKGGAPIVKVVPVRGLVRESVVFAVRGSNVRADISLPEGLWHAKLDEGQISQALGNIVINAVQAMPGGGLLRVRARNVELGAGRDVEPGRYVEIVFQDEGVGIVEDHLGRVFDPYFSTKESGSGLGLASAYSVVRRHGGNITVESTGGQGTTFTIVLPAAGAVEARAPEVTDEMAKGSGRVLVMDDEESVLRVARQMLERLGYDVECARDGTEAVKAYGAAMSVDPFVAVIMDLTVAGACGGVEAVHEIRKLDPKVRALASSGHSNDRVMAKHVEHGFVGVLPKPYGIEELGRALGDALPPRAVSEPAGAPAP